MLFCGLGSVAGIRAESWRCLLCRHQPIWERKRVGCLRFSLDSCPWTTLHNAGGGRPGLCRHRSRLAKPKGPWQWALPDPLFTHGRLAAGTVLPTPFTTWPAPPSLLLQSKKLMEPSTDEPFQPRTEINRRSSLSESPLRAAPIPRMGVSATEPEVGSAYVDSHHCVSLYLGAYRQAFPISYNHQGYPVPLGNGGIQLRCRCRGQGSILDGTWHKSATIQYGRLGTRWGHWTIVGALKSRIWCWRLTAPVPSQFLSAA